MIIAIMESQSKFIVGKDLCKISERFRALKKMLKYKDVQSILQKAMNVNLSKDSFENYLNDFFRGEAEKIISKKRHCVNIPKDEETNKWPKSYEASFESYAIRIEGLKHQYYKDIKQYQDKIAAVETKLFTYDYYL